MIPRLHRLTSPRDFRCAVRSGVRASSSVLVIHHLASMRISVEMTAPARVGFVVAGTVGNAVARNRIKRRLRHLCLGHLAGLAPGSRTVIRALPAASTASYAELGDALERCLTRVCRHTEAER
ncbi:MAG: ribonuclease P protein component [Nocardioides sp.]